jgi:betaine-aldehyde dehydrogenase
MKTYEAFYIDGQWRPPATAASREVINPSTEEVCGRVPEGEAADVAAAVQAARRAFDSWSTTAPIERGTFLQAIKQGIRARQDELALTIATELGMPLPMAKTVQVGMPAAVMGSYASLLREFPWQEEVGNSLILREAVGVVGCITPWNFPLHQVVAKVAPALAAGCTVVLKPSEVTPLTAFLLAEIIHEAGLPAGVFNLVCGAGPVVGEALASHPDIDMISFTGSTRAGRRVAELAVQDIKRVALELGGKSANVILDDADFEKAVRAGVNSCYFNSGQTCSAHTRMLVPADRLEEAASIAKETAERFTLGDAVAGQSKLGPLVSAQQRERVRHYIRQGIAEGATLVTGGAEAPEGLEKGYFVRPTVFSGVANTMTIAREEIFGPVLSIIPYQDEEDAIRIANDSPYGLGGGVWSGDPQRAERVARRLRTGQVDINGGNFNLFAPFGGYKKSGLGREFGKWGLEEYLEVKSLQR